LRRLGCPALLGAFRLLLGDLGFHLLHFQLQGLELLRLGIGVVGLALRLVGDLLLETLQLLFQLRDGGTTARGGS